MDTELEKKALTLAEKAKAIAVKNDNDFRQAGDYLKSAKALEGEIRSAFDPIIESAHQAHKVAIGQRDIALKPVQQAQTIVKKAMGDYQMEQDRIKRELEAEERKRVEEETRKLREAEEARRKAEAEALRKAGNAKAAAELASRPVPEIKIAPTKIDATPKIQGLHFREDWKFRIVNRDLIPDSYWIVDEQLIASVVRVDKDKVRIPGIEVYSEKTPVTR